MLRQTPFFFKRQAIPAGAAQRNIIKAHIEEPGMATATDIVALYELNNNKVNSDPNTLGLYGDWTGTPETYGTHVGILYDNGFVNYLTGAGLQKNNWGSGTLDTYFNADGVTFSWIAKPTSTADARLMQYWQADLEYIDLFFSDTDTLRLSVSLGAGTVQSDDAAVSSLEIEDGNFHHFVVTFNPAGDRIARLYIGGVLTLETAAVAGSVDFGDTLSDIRRGIGFGCSYTATNTNYSGPVDHVTIIKGEFTPTFTGLDNRLLYKGNFVRYYGGLVYYTPE